MVINMWDLENLVDVSKLYVGDPNKTNLDYLLSLIKQTEKYERASALNTLVEFTTSDEVYNLLGLYSISIDFGDNNKKYYLTGSMDIVSNILNSYSRSINSLVVLYYNITGLGHYNKVMSYSNFMKLCLNFYSFNNLNTYFEAMFNHKLNLEEDFIKPSSKGLDFLSFVKSNNIVLQSPVLLKVTPRYFRYKSNIKNYLNSDLQYYLNEIGPHVPLVLDVEFYQLCNLYSTYDEATVKSFLDVLSAHNIKISCSDLNGYNIKLSEVVFEPELFNTYHSLVIGFKESTLIYVSRLFMPYVV